MIYKFRIWVYKPVTTEIFVDLTDLNSGNAVSDVIGKEGAANCHIGKIDTSIMGTIQGATMQCLEVPTGGTADVDLITGSDGTATEDTAAADDENVIVSGGNFTIGLTRAGDTNLGNGRFLYLASGAAGNATYTKGKFLITLIGTF